MDIATLVVDLVIVLWFLAVILATVRAWQARRPRLAPLSSEAHNQFMRSWHRITTGFVDAPRQAVHEADALVLSLLRARGWSGQNDRLPKAIRDARQYLGRESTDETEALRQAMLRYQSIFKQSMGRRPIAADQHDIRRREMA